MEEEMEELCAGRASDPRRPRVMRRRPVRAWRSVDRGTRRPGYRAAKCESGVPTLSMKRKATLLAALARAVRGPRAVIEPGHVRNLHAREPGEPVPPAWLITGRAAQGTPRR
jgi:hypothetical protein